MMKRIASLVIAAALLAGCSALADEQPFTATITYDVGADGRLIVVPLQISGDSRYGLVQVVNNTPVNRGFAIDQLAVYETIPRNGSRTVNVPEAQDGHTYTYYDHLHPKDFRGRLVVRYVAEENR